MRERNKFFSFIEDPYVRSAILVETTYAFLSDTEVQKFIKYDQSSFDLVIVESFFQECNVALGHKYNAPIISVVPEAPWVSVSRWAANPIDFSYIKDLMVDSGKTLNFWDRFTNTYIGLYSLFVEPITYLPKMENIMNKLFQYPGYENRPTMIKMLKNISLSLIDSDMMILSARPYVPSFIEVPGIHMRTIKKMDEVNFYDFSFTFSVTYRIAFNILNILNLQNLQNFMNSATMGVVYFNFGTILNVTSIPKPSMQALINVLGRLEQKIVFRWINNDARGFPDNFYVDSWFPQSAILSNNLLKT